MVQARFLYLFQKLNFHLIYFLFLKQKIYNELDGVTQTIAVECSKRMSLAEIYTNTSDYTSCLKTLGTATFDTNVAYKYQNYMRGTRNSSSCAAQTISETFNGGSAANRAYTKAGGIKLRNGACIWFRAIASTESGYNATDYIGSILVDVNGAEGPNATGDGNDRFVIYVGKDGITSDMPKQ